MSGKIYLICHNDQPVYVGFTTQRLNLRWQQHVSKHKHSKCVLYSAMRKYGITNFTIELVCEHPDAQYTLKVLEPLYIELYGTHVDANGYNMTFGGDRSPTTLGRKLSSEHRAKIGAAHKGRKFSSQHILNIGAASKGRKFSPEARARMSAAQKLRRKNLKEQLCPHCVDNTAH